MAVSHRIVVMNKGKFDQVGTPDEIYDHPQTLHVASFIGEMNFIDKKVTPSLSARRTWK